jgi:diguanylate cyclase (GGDEF)-like protein
MELDRATAALLQDRDDGPLAECWQAMDAQVDQQSMLYQVEHHLEALRQLGSRVGTSPLLGGQASSASILAEVSRLGGLDWQAAALAEKPQVDMLNDACELLLRLLAAQLAWTLDHAHLLEMAYRMAVTDGLTGLFNRRHFDQRLTEESLRAGRYGHPLSLIMLDIDHFKWFNDRYGHLEGDRLLVRVARLIEESVRRTDLVARYGGDEFVLLLPETDTEGARQAAERVWRSVTDLALGPTICQPTPSQSGYRVQARGENRPRRAVTVSAGVATCRLGGSSPDKLLAAADCALYRAKSRGRDCVQGPEVITGLRVSGECQAAEEG